MSYRGHKMIWKNSEIYFGGVQEGRLKQKIALVPQMINKKPILTLLTDYEFHYELNCTSKIIFLKLFEPDFGANRKFTNFYKFLNKI